MYTNTDCTIYLRSEEGYVPKYIPACFWSETKARETKKYGAENADSVKIFIPYEHLSGYMSEWDISENSYITKGAPADVSDGITPLIESGEAYSVASVTNSLYGSKTMQHITIGGN